MVAEEWSPTAMRYAVGQDGRLGRVTGHYLGSVYLRPPGGGREWSSPPEELRQPTAQELAQIRVLTTRVPVMNGVTRDRQSSPGVAAVVLSADYELRPRPEPATGCVQCASLVQWFDYSMAAGPQHDESAAVDCVVEIRNHPHDPPKMGIKEFVPQCPATREAQQPLSNRRERKMGWGTGKGGSGGGGQHSGPKDPGTSKPSPDTAKPKDPPKHGKGK